MSTNPMTLPEAIKLLEAHQLWRRDDTGFAPMQNPTEIGEAIDVALSILRPMAKKRK